MRPGLRPGSHDDPVIDRAPRTPGLRHEVLVASAFLIVMATTGLPTPLYPRYREALGLSSRDVTAVNGVYAVVVLAERLERPGALLAGLVAALFVAVCAGASLPTIAAGLLATTLSLTTAVVVLSSFVVLTAAGAGVVRGAARRRTASVVSSA